jgi:hypothetical protein
MCIEEQHHSVTIEEHGLLCDCMRKLPAGSGLLNVLLDLRMDPAIPVEIALAKGWQHEQCTAWICALGMKEKIDNDIIITLLHRGDRRDLLVLSLFVLFLPSLVSFLPLHIFFGFVTGTI